MSFFNDFFMVPGRPHPTIHSKIFEWIEGQAPEGHFQKRHQKYMKNQAKIDAKMDPKIAINIYAKGSGRMGPHGALLGSLFDPKWSPNGPQAAPKWTPNGPKWLQRAPLLAPRAPHETQRCPKPPPRHLCDCSGLDSSSSWVGFWCSGLDLQGSRLVFPVFTRILLFCMAFLAFLRGFWSVLLFLG